MNSAKRLSLAAVLLGIGLAGCTPANFIQRAQPAPACDVRICLNVGASPARCDCKSHNQVQRQIREVWAQRLE